MKKLYEEAKSRHTSVEDLKSKLRQNDKSLLVMYTKKLDMKPQPEDAT